MSTRAAAGSIEADLTKWAAWPPAEVHRRLAGVGAPWCVAGGWAIDLFLGGQRREHEDLEIAVPRDRFGEVAAALGEFEFFVPTAPGRLAPLAGSDARGLLEGSHQTWAREPATGLWRLDVFREPHDGDTWICRRDERIRMPYDRLVERAAEGIPYVRPEVVLLFKAKRVRPKDEDELAAVLPRLEPDRRRLLARLLERVHPEHRWLPRITAPV